MRIRAAARGALGAAYVVALGFVSIFALNISVWLFEQTQGATFQSVLRDTARTWLSAHGVPVHFKATKLGSLEVPTYIYDLIPLGFSILICWAMYRSGRKLSGEQFLGFSWIGAIAAYLSVAVFLTSTAAKKAIFVIQWQGVFIPTALFVALFILGSVVGKPILLDDS
jgi:hypothetical protein